LRRRRLGACTLGLIGNAVNRRRVRPPFGATD